MSSCFSRCLRVPIAMRRFYEQSLWIPQKFWFTNLDLHHGLISAIALILAYATVTNIGPPVWRAALMFAVYLATRLLYRGRAMLNALGAAALALLIVDPQALFCAGFQMTFLCVGLVGGVGSPLLQRAIYPYCGGRCMWTCLA